MKRRDAIETLTRRRDYLAERLHAIHTDAPRGQWRGESWVRAEHAALVWALDQLAADEQEPSP